MATTKGKVIAEHAVTVTHNDTHVLVSWDGKVQYRALQDGWTSEVGAIREAAMMLLDTQGCWVEVAQSNVTRCAGPVHYTMRLRVKD